MKLKMKKLSDKAVIPQYQTEGAAGLDLVAATKELKPEKNGVIIEYDTHLAVEIPSGYVGLVVPRSSISVNTTLSLSNSVGIIDSDYRGSIKFRFRNTNQFFLKDYNVGDRIGQLIIVPVTRVYVEEVDELSETVRGEGSFGSTGK